MNEWGDPPAKRARTQIKAVIREKTSKPASSGSKRRIKKAKTVSKSRKAGRADAPALPLSERRRSGRSHKTATYTEREDAEDEEEMLDGVAEWEYENGSGEEEEGSDQESSEQGSAEEEDESDGEEEEEEKAAPPAKSNGRAGAKTAKPAVKSSVLDQLKQGARSSRRRGKAVDDDSDMDED